MSNTEPSYFAAIDLGSNSFHMIIARVDNEAIDTVDRVKEMVQLARGMESKRITQEAQDRAIDCLKRFSERLKNIPIHKVRAVATKSLRSAQNAKAFMLHAEAALGHPISIISGYEEARLVYKGLSHTVNTDAKKRLVIDVGGGSSEFIIGQRTDAHLLESLNIGCVVYADKFDLKSDITAKKMRKAYYAARLRIAKIRNIYLNEGWDIVYGTAGTMKSIADLLKDTCGGVVINLESILVLKQAIIDDSEKALESLPRLRRDVIPAGVAILWAIFKEFKIDKIRVADATLKEGLIFDTFGRLNNRDARYAAIKNLQKQYRIDTVQAQRVARSALSFWGAIKTPIFPGVSRTKLLTWSAKVHEIGLAISHSGHHKHSFYILRHSDLAGFGRYEQLILASLVRSHRKKLGPDSISAFDEAAKEGLRPLILCLRVAVILNRRREDIHVSPKLTCHNGEYTLEFPDGWLEQHPLTEAGLTQEIRHLSNIDIKLDIIAPYDN